MKLAIFRQLSLINNAGYRAYVVGGCVRDLFYDEPNCDIDITTDAPMKVLLKIFAEYNPKSFKFNSIKYKYKSYNIEITGLRKEIYDGNTTEVISTIFLKDDYLRRDLNGLYMSKDEVFLDFNNSIKCCIERESTCIGNFLKKCEEDPIRIVRYIYYVSKYHLFINDEYKLVDFSHLEFNKVNKVVLNKYIFRLFKMNDIDRVLKLFKEFNIYNQLFKKEYKKERESARKILEEIGYVYLNVN